MTHFVASLLCCCSVFWWHCHLKTNLLSTCSVCVQILFGVIAAQFNVDLKVFFLMQSQLHALLLSGIMLCTKVCGILQNKCLTIH